MISCRWEDAAERIMEVYLLSPEERQELGMAGHDWAKSEEAGFTGRYQALRFIEAADELFSTWIPRHKFEFIKTNEYKPSKLNHKLVY
jgi:hypothetical protein